MVALIFKKVFFAKKDVPFVMELPPYRIPTLRNTTLHMWQKGVQYIQKMGGIILVASILIWALSYYPRDIKFSQDYEALLTKISTDSLSADSIKQEKINKIELIKESERQEQSYIGQLGHFIEPVILPLGFDWKIGVSIITGLAAKEIVVSSMGILYQADIEADENSGSLIKNLHEQVHKSGKLAGKKVFSQLVAFGFMIFVLIYFPCVAVIAAIKKESNWRWAIFSMFYTTFIAWLVSFISYQLGSLFI
jgi:ferrous iron transport protein B